MMILPKSKALPGSTSRPVILPTRVEYDPPGPLLPVLPSGSVRVTIAGAPFVSVADMAAPPLPRKPAGGGGTVDLMKRSIEPGTPAASAPAKLTGTPGAGMSWVYLHLELPPWFAHLTSATGNETSPRGVVRS